MRSMLTRFVCLIAMALASTHSAFAAVTTGNLLVNSGGELGTDHWHLNSNGPTLLRDGPLSLPNGVALVATEGTHWFGADVTYSDPTLSADSAAATQVLEAHPFANVEAITVGMDVTGAGTTLFGDGLPIVRPVVVIQYRDINAGYLGVTFVAFGPNGAAETIELQSGTAIGLAQLRATKAISLPLGTAFIEAEFRMETGMSESTLASQVRVLAGIDNAFLSLTYTPIPGDYNLNGDVDAADFVVWRDSQLGSLVDQYSGADGNGNGVIDLDDYNVWRAHFGQTSASGTTLPVADSQPTVPEPATLALLGIAAIGLRNRRWRALPRE